jgi:hypothetical protein
MAQNDGYPNFEEEKMSGVEVFFFGLLLILLTLIGIWVLLRVF